MHLRNEDDSQFQDANEDHLDLLRQEYCLILQKIVKISRKFAHDLLSSKAMKPPDRIVKMLVLKATSNEQDQIPLLNRLRDSWKSLWRRKAPNYSCESKIEAVNVSDNICRHLRGRKSHLMKFDQHHCNARISILEKTFLWKVLRSSIHTFCCNLLP